MLSDVHSLAINRTKLKQPKNNVARYMRARVANSLIASRRGIEWWTMCRLDDDLLAHRAWIIFNICLLWWKQKNTNKFVQMEFPEGLPPLLKTQINSSCRDQNRRSLLCRCESKVWQPRCRGLKRTRREKTQGLTWFSHMMSSFTRFEEFFGRTSNSAGG